MGRRQPAGRPPSTPPPAVDPDAEAPESPGFIGSAVDSRHMALIDTAFGMLHVLFAGIWSGTTVFYAWRIHPLLSEGEIDATSAMSITTGLRWLTRIGAVVFVVTGGHMAGTGYGDGRLFSDPMGHAVLGMLTLWLVVTGLLEMAIGKMQPHLGDGRIQTAGRETETFIKVAATFSVVLLLLGGYLSQPLV